MTKRRFFKNLIYIIFYGVIGTFLNFMLLTTMNYVMRKNHIFELSVNEICLFAAALSSKDSFTASIMIDHHHESDLHSIVFGEGIMNDSTALTLFGAILNFKNLQSIRELNYEEPFLIIGNTILSFIIAACIGTVIGVLGSLALKNKFFRS